MTALSSNTDNLKSNDNLIWLDMEMSGLLPDSDRILELAAVVTDADLNVLGESPVLVIHQADSVLDGMDAWNKGTHGRSGLIEKVKASTLDEQAATEQMIAFLKQYVNRPCAAIRSVRIDALWRATCQTWKAISIIVIWM